MSTPHSHQKIEARFRLLQARLEVLSARAEVAHADVQAEQRRQVALLQDNFAGARARFDEMTADGNEKVDVLKDGFESAWKELQIAFKKVAE